MSDPFAALLAKQPAAETQEEDADPFNSLLKKGKSAAAPEAAPLSGPRMSRPKPPEDNQTRFRWKGALETSLEDLQEPPTAPGAIPTNSRFTARTQTPPKAEQDPSTLGKLVRGKGVLETTADIVDLGLVGVPAAVVGAVGDVTNRASALARGQSWREAGRAGNAFFNHQMEVAGRPAYDALKRMGLIDPQTNSIPQQAMAKVGDWLTRQAEISEQTTGLPKEDYLSSVNGFMALMGVKGAKFAVKDGVRVPFTSIGIKGLDERVAAGNRSAWDVALERFEAEERLARAKFEEVTPERTAAKAAAERPAGDPLYGENFAAEAAARRKAYEQRKAYEKGVRDFPPSGERTGSRDAVDLSLEGKETPTTYGGNQPFHTADTTAALKRGVVADTPIQTEGRLAPVAATPLDSGLLKVKENRLFDMTMEERLAVKNSTKITDPKVITAAAVGATGLGLAMAYEPSAEEAAMAIGAGVLLRRGGVGESMRELAARPDATPLGAMLEASAYTTSTLEKLADASPGKFEFKKAAVEQLLKREGVTKHERDLMMAALAQAPGGTITAKQLMVGLRVAAQDFELTPAKSSSYADYGLERIGRESLNPELAEEFSLQGTFDSLEPTTRIYRSPLELGSNNHFQDPNYFAHTRSFVEDGVRHVVELQSDLAQKSPSKLAPDARQQLTLRAERLKREIQGLEAKRHAEHTKLGERLSELQKKGLDATSFEWKEEGRYYREQLRELDGQENDFRVEQAEIQAKLTEAASAEARAPAAPMLKDWHKRLVREELADAARNLEGSVRFATADTVAKVEGWPRELRYKEGAAAFDPELKKNTRVGSVTSDAGTRHFGEFRYTGNLKVVGGRVFSELESGNGVKFWSSEFAKIRSEEAAKALGMADGFRPEHQGIYDRYSRDVEKFLRQLGAQPITDSAGHTWLEVPLGEQQKALPGGGARTQIGGVDPALLKGAAAVGGTAALAWTLSSPKEKHRHALWTGALVGLGLYAKSRNPTIAKLASDFAKGTQMMFGNLSTDKAMTPAILRRLGNFEMDVQVAGHTAVRKIAPFVEQLDAIPAGLRPLIDTALANGKLPEIKAALGRYGTPELLKALDQTRALLNDLGKQAQEVKLLKELRPDYFPRIVKDMEGLLKALGKDYGTDLQIALKQAETRAGGLDEVGRSELINRFLEKHTRQAPGSGKAGFLKRRTIDNVTIDLAPFYVEPTQALPLYVGGMVRAIEKAKFFGKDLIVDPESGRPNLAASIGAVVARELKAGSITPETYERLEGLLRSRFGPGEQSPHRALQSLSQFTNIALLANAFSAAMNLADIGGIAAQQGPLAVIKALQKKLTGKASLTATDVGMAEAIGAEFIYGTRDPIKMRIPLTEHQVHVSMSKAIDKTFRLAGFRAADIVMKEVHLNAAIEKYQKLSRTAAGEKRIVRQYGAYFTSDMGQLLSDLRAGQKTRLTTELAFRELSDAQPTTRIEMPQLYLNHPNFRFAFALKSFMVKQLNLIKKRGIAELLRGNVKEGTGFLLRYALFAGSAGASMNWIVQSLLGRDEDLDWGSIPLHAMKNFGLSQYVLEKMQQGKGKEAIASAFAPPLDPILNIASGDPEGVRHVPLVGRLVYDRAMDGAEKANAAKKLAEKKKKRDAERTPSERRELERRALERRQRLLQEN